MVKHYFSREQESESNPEIISFEASGRTFEFYTDSGIFSRKKLDKAAKLLIESSEIPEHARILDLGCGWGAVGICLKKIRPDIEVVMTDVNMRALYIANKNKKKNNVSLKIKESDGFEKLKEEKFDVVLFNPPQTAGKKVWQRLILEAKKHTRNIQVVARHNKGGKSIQSFLEENFGNSKVLDRSAGYRIYSSNNLIE